jgi:hypothetical protein
MGMFLRPRRPIARLAAGAATAGVAYHLGHKNAEQEVMQSGEMQNVYEASLIAPVPQYWPSQSQTASTTDDLECLVRFHERGILGDAEFDAAKARLLGL